MNAAVILAAGSSSRMGFPKQLAEVRDKPLLQAIIDKVNINFDNSSVVLGSENEIISEKIDFIEREINRLGNIKGSDDVLNEAINMARQGNSKEEIINKTGLREDEVEAIYTYYKK